MLFDHHRLFLYGFGFGCIGALLFQSWPPMFGFRKSGFQLGKEVAGRAIQSGRKCEQHRQRGLVLPEFKHADIVPPDRRLKRELFLRQSSG